ncbi:MAG: MFS transporter [Candidatus Eisenbacteria bacterium]|nr:MFS transporter [Candidatus Eisenbacteria bacterium]
MAHSDTEAEHPGAPEAPKAAADGHGSLTLGESVKVLFSASRAFWLVNLVNFGDGIAYFGVLNLLTLFISGSVGFSDHMTGIAVSSFTGLVTLCMFGGGFVSDRLGVRHALTLSLAGVLLGRILLTLSPGMGGVAAVTLWAGLIVMGVAEGVIQPALYAGVKEFTDPRTATIGYSLLYAIMNLGIWAEAMVSPFIRAHGGISSVFWWMIGFTVLMLVANVLLFTKKVEDRDRVVAYVVKPEHDRRTLGAKIKELPFMDSRFQFFIFVLLPVRTLFAHQWLTLPDYVMRCFPKAVGARYEWFQGLNPFVIVIFVPLLAALTRRVNIITMMILGTAVSAVTTFILVPGPHLGTLITYVVLFSFGEAMWASRFLEYVANLAPAGKVGAYMGLAGIPWFLAKATTGLYSGLMIERFLPRNGPQDSGTMWFIYGCVALISPVGLLLGKKWVQRGSQAVR